MRYITFNGETIVHPGAVSKIDVTAMAQKGLTTKGVIGLLGEADGGPHSTLITMDDPSVAKATFTRGPLADAIRLAFYGGKDPRVPSGAFRVICYKTNQSTQASITLTGQADLGTNLVNQVVLKSVSYGALANYLAVAFLNLDTAAHNVPASDIYPGIFEARIYDDADGTEEVITDIGGRDLFDLQFKGPEDSIVLYRGIATGGSATVLTDASVPAWLAFTDPYVTNLFVRIVSSSTATVVGQYRRVKSGLATVTGSQGEPFALIGADTFKYTPIVEGVAQPAIQLTSTLGAVPAATAAVVAAELQTLDDAAGGHLNFTALGGAVVITMKYGGAQNSFTIGANIDSTLNVILGFTPAASYAGTAGWINSTSIEVATAFDAVVPVASVYEVVSLRVDAVVTSYVAATKLLTLTSKFKVATTDTLYWNNKYVRMLSGNAEGEIRKIVSYTAVAGILAITLDEAFLSAPVATDTLALIDATSASVTIAGSAGAATTFTSTVSFGLSYKSAGSVTDSVTLSSIKTVGDLAVDFNMLLADNHIGTDVPTFVRNKASIGSNYYGKVGNGRATTILTTVFDFDNKNTGIDIVSDFDRDPYRYCRFKDDLNQFIEAINTQSSKITATRSVSTGATVGAGLPDWVSSDSKLYFTSGSRGVSTNTNWQDGFDALLKRRVNIVVPLISRDLSLEGLGSTASVKSVHAMLIEHVMAAQGGGKNERNGYASYYDAGSGALANIIKRAGDIGSHLVHLCFQSPTVLNVDGTLTAQMPWAHACLAASMQAGVAVGEPLTFKYLNVSDVSSNSTYIDVSDLTTNNQLLLGGVLFSEYIEGKGHRWVRFLTTYTASDNLALTDGNVVEVLNYVSYDLRTFLEDKYTGVRAGPPATIGAIKSDTIAKMQQYTQEGIIVPSMDPDTKAISKAYRNFRFSLSGDIINITGEIFPVTGINYILFTLFAQLPTWVE